MKTSYKETNWKKLVRIILKNNLKVKFQGYSSPIIAKNIKENNHFDDLPEEDKKFVSKIQNEVIF